MTSTCFGQHPLLPAETAPDWNSGHTSQAIQHIHTGGDRAVDLPHPNAITPSNLQHNTPIATYLLSNLLTEKMGKPSPTTVSIVDVTVLSWYGYWMLLSLQKKPLWNGYIWPKFRTAIGMEAVGEGRKDTHGYIQFTSSGSQVYQMGCKSQTWCPFWKRIHTP